MSVVGWLQLHLLALLLLAPHFCPAAQNKRDIFASSTDAYHTSPFYFSASQSALPLDRDISLVTYLSFSELSHLGTVPLSPAP